MFEAVEQCDRCKSRCCVKHMMKLMGTVYCLECHNADRKATAKAKVQAQKDRAKQLEAAVKRYEAAEQKMAKDRSRTKALNEEKKRLEQIMQRQQL